MRVGWLNNPEYVQFVEFLVEETKEVKTVLNILELAGEFKRKVNSSLKARSIERRIQRFRPEIHKMPHLDTETKVKLIFGLSAPVHCQLLEELKEEAEVTVDDFDRIIHYKKNDGGLELQGVHAETGNSQHNRHLDRRIREAMKHIYESELFNEDMKVKMLFATRRKVEDYALKKFRENATVELDDDNRIIKYEKNDGSLNLRTEAIRRVSSDQKQKRKCDIKSDDEGDSEEDNNGDEESREDSEEEEETMEVTTRSGRVSKKRFSDTSFFNNKDYMGNSSQRNERSKSSDTSKTSNQKRKTSAQTNGSVGKGKKTVKALTPEKKETQEKAVEEDYDDDYSIDFSYQYNDENRAKLEPFNGPLNDDTRRTHIVNNGDDFVEEIPAPTENFVAPKYEEIEVKLEEPDYSNSNFSNNQYKNESIQQDFTSSEDVKKDHTSLPTILEAFHGFIEMLDLPILSDLQKKIEAKLEECRGDSSLKTVSNEEICLSLQLCLLKVNKSWESKESVESLRLESFMISFRHAVVHMKCPSLVEFQKKLKKIIGELRVQNKFIPVTAIRSALQNVIENVIDF